MPVDISPLAKAIAIPSGYAKFRLGIKMHPKQAAVVNAVFAGSKTRVSALFGNELGKTSVCGVVSILYALEIRNAIVVSTSATYRQIIKQLLPALKKYSHLYTNYGWEFLENSIKIKGESRYVAFQTTDQGKWQGWHGTPEQPLYIFTDESAALDENVFQSISRCNPDYLLCAGSPLAPEGVFYSIETEEMMKSKFVHFKMTKFDALEKDGWWIKEKDVEDFIAMWGGRTHPLVLSSVYAEFASNIENGLITLAELTKCYQYPPNRNNDPVQHVGIDVAASGGDSNVIAFRRGNEVEILDVWREDEVMRSCDRIAIKLNELKEKYNVTAGQVSLDADGMGIGFVSRLKDLGWSIIEFHGGATPLNGAYSSYISECWLEGIKKIKNCAIILPDNQEFKMQLLSRKQLFSDKGKLKLESKKDMKARGVHSPDIADALFIAMSEPNKGVLDQALIQQYYPRPEAKQYRMF